MSFRARGETTNIRPKFFPSAHCAAGHQEANKETLQLKSHSDTKKQQKHVAACTDEDQRTNTTEQDPAIKLRSQYRAAMKQKYSGQKFLHPEVELFSVSISLSVEERRHLHSDTPRCKTSGGPAADACLLSLILIMLTTPFITYLT